MQDAGNIQLGMKTMMMLGGLLGFLMGIGFGLEQGVSWSSIIWRSSVSALAGGVLLRWWGGVCLTGLQQAHEEKLALAAKLEAEKAQNRDKS